MTTLVHPTPSAAAAGARPYPSIDLPSGLPPQAQAAAVPAEPAPRKTGLLTWLLAGTAAAGVLGMIGTGLVATLSRAGHPVPPPAEWLGMPPAVSPQQPPGQMSQPAPAPLPSPNAPALPGTRPLPAPAAAVPVSVPTPRSSADDLRALKQSGPYAPPAPPRPAPAAASAPAMQAVPVDPSVAGQPDAKAMLAPGSETGPASLAGNPSPDPGAAAAPQALVNMVAALADDIAQERRGDAEMHHQIESLLHDTDQRLSEFDRRLTVVEANPLPAFARVGSGRGSAGTLSAMRTALPAAPPSGGRPYEIRAASPGVAVLGTLDGTPAVVEVAVGDQVPGYGRVNAIAQRGSAWAVQCEHGIIQ